MSLPEFLSEKYKVEYSRHNIPGLASEYLEGGAILSVFRRHLAEIWWHNPA